MRPLAIVVVNYGSHELLEQNLVRTARECAPDLVVVVDNLSTPGERRRVSELAAQHGWELVTPEGNLGFGGGVNAGVTRARERGAGEWLVLNPDAAIDADSLRELRAAVAERPTTMVSPRVVDSDGRVWFAGADVYLRDGLTMSAAKRATRAGEDHWAWLSGACLLITDAAWELSGGFDDDYFLYWEDVDLSRRLVEAGGAIAVVPQATAIHDEGGTHGGGGRAKSPTYYYYVIRNRLLFAAKHLDDEGVRRWKRSAWASAKETVLRGGRRQLLRPWAPLSAAWRGVRDGRRLVRRLRGL